MRRCSTLEELVKLNEIYEVYLNYVVLNCIRNQTINNESFEIDVAQNMKIPVLVGDTEDEIRPSGQSMVSSCK